MRIHAGVGTALPVVLLALLALGLRGAILSLGEDRLSQIGSDDMFYYLEGSRRAVESGSDPTMDGTFPTSGFQPLYMGLAAAIHVVADPLPWTPVEILMAFNLLLGLALSVGVWRLASRESDGPQGAAFVLLAVTVLSPVWIAHGVVGVENMLNAAIVLILLLRIAPRLSRPTAAEPWKGRNLLLDGLLIGFAGLCRTDNALLVAGIAVALLFHADADARMRRVRWALGAGAVALIVVSPWLVILLKQQGSIVQDSARALSARTRMEAGGALIPLGTAVARNTFFWIYRLGHGVLGIPFTALLLSACLIGGRVRRTLEPGPLLTAASVATVLLLFLRRNSVWNITDYGQLAIEMGALLAFAGLGVLIRLPQPASGAPLMTLLLLPAGAMLVVYSLFFRHFQLWYVTSSIVLLVALAVRFLGLLLRDATPSVRWVVMGAALVTATLETQRILVSGTYQAFQDRPAPAALRSRLEALFPVTEGPRVGSFDSGELSYRAHPYPIVNLDGVMNHEAAVALENGTYPAFLAGTGIEYAIGSQESRLSLFSQIGGFVYETSDSLSQELGLPVARIQGR